MLELNGFYNMDCIDGMKQFPDKYFEMEQIILKISNAEERATVQFSKEVE